MRNPHLLGQRVHFVDRPPLGCELIGWLGSHSEIPPRVDAAETAGHAPLNLNPSDVEFTTILGVVKKAIQQWIEKKRALGADAGFIGEGDVSGVDCIAQVPFFSARALKPRNTNLAAQSFL